MGAALKKPEQAVEAISLLVDKSPTRTERASHIIMYILLELPLELVLARR
jgi:hypothetical protein